MAAGSIVVDLLLKTGSFETDTQRASKSLKKFQKDAEAAGKAVGLAFTGAVVGIAALVTRSIDAADHLNDLSKKTGIAADTLGGIGFAASQAGGDIESATAAAGKLNKSLAEAAAGNPQAAEAFKALGINVLDAAGNTKKADVALAEIADKFAGYADGPEKAALALRIFGKAGADIIPLLDDGGKALLDNIDYYKRYSGVTVDTAEKADQFNDTLGKLKLLAGAFGQQLASESLPLLQTLADRFLGAKEEGDGFKTASDGIVSVLKGLVIAGAYVVDTFQGVGREIGAIAAQGVALAHLDFKGFTAIGDAVKEDGVRAKAELDKFVNNVLNPALSGTAGPTKPGGGTKPPAPRLPSTNAASDASDSLKKQLDGQLKLIQDFERAQADAYKIGESFLEGVYQDGLISQQDYFAAQKNLRDANLQNSLDAIDKEIAAQRAFAANPAAKPADRVAAEEKIKLAVQQRANAVTAASGADILAAQASGRAVKQLADAYGDLNAQVLSASGNDFAANQIRNARQVADAQKLVNQARANPQLGGSVDPDLPNKLGRALDAQNAFNKAQTEGSRISDQLSIAEQRIALAQQSGALAENAALQQTGEARHAAVAQMESMVAAQEAIAKASDNPALVLNAQKARLELDKLKASLDPLKDKFDNLFKDAGANAFDALFNGGSLKDVGKQFFQQILQSFNKDTAKELSDAIFGKGGIFGNLGATLASGQQSAGGFGGQIAEFFGLKKPATDSVPDSGLKDLFKTPNADAASGLAALRSEGIDPATAALLRMAQAADTASASFGGSPAAGSTSPADSFVPAGGFDFSQAPSGEQSTFDLFKAANEASTKSAAATADFGTEATAAASLVTQLGRAAGSGSSALASLPGIVSAFQAVVAATGASSSASSGGSWLSAIGSLFGGSSTSGLSDAAVSSGASLTANGFAGFATGGRPPVGVPSMIGERGPELFVPDRPGTVVPNGQLNGAMNAPQINVTQNFAISGPASKSTQDQIASAALRGAQRALARNH